ncbi:hypothetical protein BGZ49_000880, partial [Haplosporangium sp. Z 27]
MFDTDQYFHPDEIYASPYIKYHKSSMSLLIRSEAGTGKTTFLEQFIQRNPKLTYLAISPRQTLAFSLEERLGFKSYLDFPSTYIRGQKIVIQAESLHRLDLAYYTMDLVLILDEASSIFDQMTSVTTMRGFHKVNNDILRDFIKVSKKVIALDADLTDRDVQVVKELRDDVHVIHNTFKPQQGDLVSLYENEAALKLKVISLVKSGKKVWICSTQKAEDAESLHAELKDMGFIGMCITASSLELEKRTFAQDINKFAPTLDYFIHTPTITVGLDCNVPHFDYVAGFFMSQSKVSAKYTGISEAKVIGYEELLQLETRSDLSIEEYYEVQKFKIMDTYGIENPSVLTPEWVKTYSDPKEMKVFQNLQALKDDPELKMVKQNDSYPLGKDQERKNAVAVLHRLHQSKYTKLKYAKDALSACGYDSPFDPKCVASTALKSNLDEQWESISTNMRSICTQLTIPYPSHNNWNFRNQQNFLNSVLNE